MISLGGFAPFTDPRIWRFLLEGALLTLEAAGVTIALSLVAGTVLAALRLSPVLGVRIPAAAYVETVRSLPGFLVLLLVYFGIGRLDPSVSTFAAVVIGLAAYHASKNAEVIRAGILSIERGQVEAARSIGMNYRQTMRLIILPQALRRMLPPLTSEFVLTLKNTSVGGVIGLDELLHRAGVIYERYLDPIETFTVIGAIYWILCYALSRVSARLEADPAARAARAAAVIGRELRPLTPAVAPIE